MSSLASLTLLALAPLLIAAGLGLALARSAFSAAMALAAVWACAGIALAALGAPDLALAQILAGLALGGVVYLGAMLLIGRGPAAPAKPGGAIAPLLAALAAGLALGWGWLDLPVPGAADRANGAMAARAAAEAGVRNPVRGAGADLRAFDSVALIFAVFVAGAGIYGALGFGERASMRRQGEGGAP